MSRRYEDLTGPEIATEISASSILQNTHVKFGGSVSFSWLSNDLSPSTSADDADHETTGAPRIRCVAVRHK